MKEYKFMVECILCGIEFQFGPHIYKGRRVKEWDAMIGDDCERWNHDGIVLANHPKLADHLKAKGVEPELNAKGWVKIPPRG